MKESASYSINEVAEKVVGKRNIKPGSIIFDQPTELGYHCPVCKYESWTKQGDPDERLHWSQYNGFIWCQKCNKDYPSALCQPDIDKAISTYLECVHNAKVQAPLEQEIPIREAVPMNDIQKGLQILSTTAPIPCGPITPKICDCKLKDTATAKFSCHGQCKW